MCLDVRGLLLTRPISRRAKHTLRTSRLVRSALSSCAKDCGAYLSTHSCRPLSARAPIDVAASTAADADAEDEEDLSYNCACSSRSLRSSYT